MALGSFRNLLNVHYTGNILKLDGKWALGLGQLLWLTDGQPASLSSVQFKIKKIFLMFVYFLEREETEH